MILTLTSDEMLERRRLLAGLEPLRADCSIEVTEGIDVNRLLMMQLRAWYVNLLDTAPAEMLAVDDIAPRLDAEVQPTGEATVALPTDCRRLLSVKLNGWQRAAQVITDLSDSRLELAASPYGKPGPAEPLAWITPDRILHMLPGEVNGVIGSYITEAHAIVDPGPDTYVLDERAFEFLEASDILKEF